jgi:hypothetical protein
VAPTKRINNDLRDQVGLELVQVDVKRASKAEGGSDRGDDLRDQTIEVLERGLVHAEVLFADIVDRLVVDHERAVRVLERGVGREHRVVRLDDRRRKLWRGVHTELKLGLLAIVHGETLEQECTKAGASATTKRVEDKESLEAGAVICLAADLVHHRVDELLTNSVVTTGICYATKTKIGPVSTLKPDNDAHI